MQAVVEGIARGQHDDRRITPGILTQAFAQLITIDARQHDIQHDQVVVFGGRKMQPTQAILRAVDAVTLQGQVIEDIGQNIPVVFHHKNAHVRSILKRAATI